MKFSGSDVRDVAIAIVVITTISNAIVHMLVYRGFDLIKFLGDLLPNLNAGAFELIVTLFLINRLLARKQSEEQEIQTLDALKAQAKRDFSSADNAIARQAIRVLREYRWHSDGTLRGQDMEAANHLDSNLTEFDLSKTIAIYANFRRARMQRVKAQGAFFAGADFQDADIRGMEFDESTTLPDGSRWAPGIDMRIFTDPSHPQFFRSDEDRSPASQINMPAQATWNRPRRPK